MEDDDNYDDDDDEDDEDEYRNLRNEGHCYFGSKIKMTKKEPRLTKIIEKIKNELTRVNRANK